MVKRARYEAIWKDKSLESVAVWTSENGADWKDHERQPVPVYRRELAVIPCSVLKLY